MEIKALENLFLLSFGVFLISCLSLLTFAILGPEYTDTFKFFLAQTGLYYCLTFWICNVVTSNRGVVI